MGIHQANTVKLQSNIVQKAIRNFTVKDTLQMTREMRIRIIDDESCASFGCRHPYSRTLCIVRHDSMAPRARADLVEACAARETSKAIAKNAPYGKLPVGYLPQLAQYSILRWGSDRIEKGWFQYLCAKRAAFVTIALAN